MWHDILWMLVGAATFGLSEVTVVAIAARRARYDAIQSGDDVSAHP